MTTTHTTYLSWIEDADLGALLRRAGVSLQPPAPSHASSVRRAALAAEATPPRREGLGAATASVPEALRSRRSRAAGLPPSDEGALDIAAALRAGFARLATAAGPPEAPAPPEEEALPWEELHHELHAAADDMMAMALVHPEPDTMMGLDDPLDGDPLDDDPLDDLHDAAEEAELSAALPTEGLDLQLSSLVESVCDGVDVLGACVADADGLAMAVHGMGDAHLAASAVLGTALETTGRLIALRQPLHVRLALGDRLELAMVWTSGPGRRHALGLLLRQGSGDAALWKAYGQLVGLLGEEDEGC